MSNARDFSLRDRTTPIIGPNWTLVQIPRRFFPHRWKGCRWTILPSPKATLVKATPVPPPKPSTSGRCAYCGRPTKRWVLGVWACSWCDDLPGKEAL